MNNSKIRVFETVCRTCMGDQETEVLTTDTAPTIKSLISIYDEHETTNFGYIKIMELLKQTSPQLTVETDDMLPKNICDSCLDMLVKINEFQKESLRVEKRLREIIKEYDPLHDIDADPLSNNKEQQATVKVKINKPISDVTKPAKGFFTITQKDGDFVEVYNDVDKHANVRGCNDKCNTDDDVNKLASETNNMNRFWLYFEGENQEKMPIPKKQNREELVNGEVNSTTLVMPARARKRLATKTRKSNRQIKKAKEVLDESNNHIQKNYDEDVDSERPHSASLALSNDTKNVAEDESLESEQSDCNKISEEDDSEWEPSLDKSESQLDANQQDNLKPKNKAFHGYSCNECRERLKTRRGLERHLKRHIEKKQKQSEGNGHICPECGKRLKTRIILRRHVLRHATNENGIKERPYLCSICGKSFATQSNLNHHFETHSTDTKYQCSLCPKRFRCKSNMATHKAIVHTTVRPHVCDVCGASFKKPYALSKHKIIHGERKHKCDYCEMKFAQIDQCRRHMRTHTGEKPYKCRYCERAYAQSNDMIKHMRVHLGDNVYRCEMCPQAFRLLSEKRAHFALHIDDDEETKSKNLQALKEEEKRLQMKIESEKASEQQPE